MDPGPYCICNGPDDGTFMIFCDQCEEWYHGKCIGLTKEKSRSINKFVCHLCKKAPPSVGAPPAPILKKGINVAPVQPDPPMKKRTLRGQTKVPVKRQKITEDKDTAKIRHAVIEQLVSALNKGCANDKGVESSIFKYEVPDEAKIRQLSKEIEEALYASKKGTDKLYKDQIKLLRFNISTPSNIKLRSRIVTKDITPEVLVNMTNEEMAPEDILTLRREKEELSLEARLKESEDLPINKEIIWRSEEESYDPQPLIPSNGTPTDSPRRESPIEEDNDSGSLNSSFVMESDQTSQSSGDSRGQESLSVGVVPSHNIVMPKPELVPDIKIDVVVEDQTPQEEDNYLVSWRGALFYKGVVEEFRVVGHHVTGPRVDTHLAYLSKFNQNQRVDTTSILSYLSQIDSSTTRFRTLMYLEPESYLDDEMYRKLFDYLYSINRSGVIPTDTDAFRDSVFREIYVIPMKSDTTDIPAFIPRHLFSDGKDRLFVAFITDKKKLLALPDEKSPPQSSRVAEYRESEGNSLDNKENSLERVPTNNNKTNIASSNGTPGVVQDIHPMGSNPYGYLDGQHNPHPNVAPHNTMGYNTYGHYMVDPRFMSMHTQGHNSAPHQQHMSSTQMHNHTQINPKPMHDKTVPIQFDPKVLQSLTQTLAMNIKKPSP